MRIAVALVLSLTAVPLFAEAELPSLAPAVKSVFPHGVRKGSSAEIELKGENLNGASVLHFAGKGVQATILSSNRTHVLARVTANAEAETGTRDFRLTTAQGSYVGVFDVGSLDEIREAEPNDDPRKPQKITLPVLVNGVIGNEDWDHFQFHAAAGETLAFEVMATRNGSRLDADLAILDAQGRELAWNDDYYIYGDPRIEYRFDRDGDYVIRVGSLAGSASSDYRLVAGRVPWLAHTLPAGFTRGKTTELTVYGSGLENAQAIWLGDHIARGTILSRSPGALRASINVPAKAPSGNERLHVVAGGIEAPVPAQVVVGDVPEITVTTNPDTPAAALPVKTPVVVNGVVAKERASQHFSFHAEAGQRFEFRVESMHLGYPLDPVITLLDASGKRLAAADDPGIDERSDAYQLDPRLAYQFQQSGTYLVAVRDAMYRGDAAFVYRLSILADDTDFGVEVREPVKTAYLGQKTEMLLRVRRFGGWDAPVEIEAEGLPKGLLAEKVVAPPKDSIVKDTCGVERTIDGTIVHLPIRVGDVKPGLYHFTVKARGTRDARLTEHIARVDYERYAAGYFHGPMQEQRIDLTVMPAPNVIFNTPERVTLSPGHGGSIDISLGRYFDAAGVELIIDAKPLPAGLTVEPARLSGEAKQMKLKVTVAPDAQEGEIPVVLYAHRDGQAPLGESSPIVLRIRKEAAK